MNDMKQVLSMLLVFALCFALCACGKEEVAENPYEKYAKYEELFGYMEDGNYEKADAYLREFFDVPESAEETEPATSLILEF